MPIFGGVSDEVLELLVGQSQTATVTKGSFFFREGDQADALYILEKGRVIVVKNWQGCAYELGSLSAGDCFGEMGYLSKTKRTASIFSKGHVSLLKAKFTLMEQVSESCQLRFTKVFLRTLVHRLSKANARISSDSSKTN